MPRFDAAAEASDMRSALEELGGPDYAEGAKRYLKSDLTFFGTRSPDVRATTRAFLKDHPDLTRPQLVRLVKMLWKEPVHETRMTAVMLLEARTGMLEERDVALLEY